MAVLKFVIVFGVLIVSLKYLTATTMDDRIKINEAILTFISVCKEDFELSNGHHQAAGHPCFIGCLFKKSKLINDKGLFDADKGAEMIKQYLLEEGEQKKALDIIYNCKAVNDRDVTDGDNGCERAGFLFNCLIPHKKTLSQGNQGTEIECVSEKLKTATKT